MSSDLQKCTFPWFFIIFSLQTTLLHALAASAASVDDELFQSSLMAPAHPTRNKLEF
jgi:hypothetical protein